MVALLNFLNKILPPESEGFRCWVAIKDKVVKQGFCKTNEELEKILRGIDARQWNAYFACSAYKEPTNREQKNVSAVKAFWLDIDAGPGKPYLSYNEAQNALNSYLATVSLPPPTVVCSGNGLHVYWTLEKSISPKEWKSHARVLKQNIATNNLAADPARTSDEASILRPISTLNWKKPEAPLEIYTVFDAPDIALDLFVAKVNPHGFAAMQGPAVDNLGTAIVGGIAEARPNEPSSALLASRHCRQLAILRDAQGNLPEPEWYAGLCVLAHCTDGEQLAQEWSKGHPDYNPDETRKKLEQARTRSGPTTCVHYRGINPDGCKGCPHNITSPIQLGKHEATVTPPPIEPPKEGLPWLPVGYRWGNNMQILTQIDDPTEEGKKITITVCEFPFYVAAVREYETQEIAGEQTLKIMRRTPHEPWKSFTVKISDIYGQGWQSVLARFGVTCEPGMEKAFKRLIHGMIKGKTAMGKFDICYNSFGWKQDRTGFVMGRKMYRANGSEDVSGSPEFEKAADKIKPNVRGSLKKWRIAANKLFVPGCEAQAFGLLCSFAAPLMDLLFAADEGGSIVSLVSTKSGQGKTAALAAIESVWGETTCLRLTDNESLAAKFRAIGVRKNAPVVIDEWGSDDTAIIHRFITIFTGGLDKKRLTLGGEDIKEQLSWKTIAIGTTNQPVADRLRGENYAAQAVRIFEVPVSIPEHLSKTQTSEINKEFERNSGFAGPVFLTHLMKTFNLDELEIKVNNLAKTFGQQMALGTDYRFKTRMVAACAVVAQILTTPVDGEPMLEFSPAKIIGWALEIIKESAKEYTGQLTHEEQLMNFVRDNAHNFLVVDGPFNPKKPTSLIARPKQKLMGRYEKINGKLYIPNDIMHKYSTSIRIPYAEFSTYLGQVGLVLNRNRMTLLTAGVDEFAPTRASCWEIDLTHEKATEIVAFVNTLEANAVNEALSPKTL